MDGESFLSSYNEVGSGSKRWGIRSSRPITTGDSLGKGWKEMKGVAYGGAAAAAATKKRVMVVVDAGLRAKQAMMWALTHVATKGDILTLLHVLHSRHRRQGVAGTTSAAARKDKEGLQLARSLGALCKACKPEVEVEAVVIRGPKLGTVLSQVKKLEASVLVVSQRKPSPLCCLLRSSGEDFVEQCIEEAECLTFAVRKQSAGVSGYLIDTKWQRNFWLLA